MSTPEVMYSRGDFRLSDALIDCIDAILARDDDPRAYVDEILAAFPDGWTKVNGLWYEAGGLEKALAQTMQQNRELAREVGALKEQLRS